uniref:helix-turn-helix transcriptional regulator n=1 Tax=uncultured Sphingomonas sp. TaxID=158754 RepID=UPI0035CB480A
MFNANISAEAGEPQSHIELDGDGANLRDRRNDQRLRIKAVMSRTGLSVPTIYRRESEGTFPRREHIGVRCVAWYESDINDFVANPRHYRSRRSMVADGGPTPSEIISAQP